MAFAAPTISAPRTIASPLPLRAVLPWAILALALTALTLYFVGVEQGATSVFSGAFMHELVHDGRHLLGFPCH